MHPLKFLIYPVLIFTGCLGPVAELYPEDENLRPVSVYVVSHGWHVGIAVEAGAVREILPDHPEIPQTRILKFGWGDAKYYPHPSPGAGLLVRAGLLPTRSVLHVVGTDIPLESYFTNSDIIEIKVTEEGAERMADFITTYFKRNREGEVIYQERGLYSQSAFFEANGLYFLPNTSNRWTAKALRQTGFPITPFYSVTAGNVIRQAREHGKRIQQRN